VRTPRSDRLSLANDIARANNVGVSLGCAAVTVIALYPFLADDVGTTRQFLLIAIYSVVAVGLNLTLGYAGEFAIGQAGLFAVGAYATAILTGVHGWSFWQALPFSIVAAAVAGLIIGTPGLRVGGWYFALTSLFAASVLPDIVQVFPDAGGSQGVGGIPYPTFFGEQMSLIQIYLMVLVGLVIALGLVFNLLRSGWGMAFLTMRQSNPAAEAVGISVVRMKLLVYTLSAALAGFAGATFASVQGFVSPDAFPLSLSILFVAAVVIGGLGSLVGSLIGIGVIQWLPTLGTNFEKYALLVYGGLLIGTMYVIPEGAVPTARKLWVRGVVAFGRRGQRLSSQKVDILIEAASEPPASPVAPSHLMLERREGVDQLVVDNVSKQFGAVRALDGVSLSARPGVITSVIGPNGSGKTTLLNVILGFYRLDGGHVRIGSDDVTGRPPWRQARGGLGRTFQTPVIVATRSTLANVAVGMFSRRRATLVEYVLRLPRARRDDRQAQAAAMELLTFVGLADVASVEAAALSPGQQRLLELARALAHEPTALLLDEPAAGLIGDEIDALAAALRRIADLNIVVVLVEHNVQLVVAVASEVVVLDQGRVIASGAPDVVQQDPAVVASYLGAAPSHA
jgi:branched-chain amino acid transport system permease protein